MKCKIIILFVLILITSCGDSNTVVINLGKDEHLESTKAGSFLKDLDLRYSDEIDFFSSIEYRLKQKAVLEDTYQEEEDVSVKRWNLNGKFILQKSQQVDGGLFRAFHILFNGDGIEYNKLIDEKSNMIDPERDYKCGVAIISVKDNCRLLLCGFGKYCEYMMLIEGS